MTPSAITKPPAEDRLAQALEVLDAATGLLRTATATDYLFYCLGTMPFVWQLLRFWAEMSLSAHAERDLWPSAALLAQSYLWMKVGQTLFVQRLLGILRNVPVSYSPRSVWRIALETVTLQSSALVVSLCAALLMIPFAWTVAFYHHLQASSDGSGKRGSLVFGQALAQAQLWPRENHALITLHAVFSLVVYLNVWVLLLFVPQQLFTLFGFETWMLHLGRSPFNTTLLVAAGAFTMVLTDPWLKAAYAVRAFRAESVKTGHDLRVAWRKSWMKVAFIVFFGVGLLVSPRVSFAESAAPSTSAHPMGVETTSSRDAQRLDRKLNEVLNREAFAWRAPRESVPTDDDSWLRRQISAFARVVGNWFEPVLERVGKLVHWLLDLRGPSTDDSAPTPIDWGRVLSRGAVILAILMWGIPLLVILVQRLRRRRPVAATLKSAAVSEEPESEALEASKQLPSEWRAQAEHWLLAGEGRLALRALFLGDLAYLIERGEIVAMQHKTVGDYRRDLERRAHVYPDVYAGYCMVAQIFESSWYGSHPVTEEVLEQFALGSAALRHDA